MSIVTMNWVDSIQVGNATAKALLRFLCTHNFLKPGFFFKNSTYMRALEISEKTLQRAFNHLETKGFITIERRFDEDGRQISNGIYLNVPDKFVQEYESKFGQNDGVGGGVIMTTLGASNCRGGGRQADDPYNNNINNNKYNTKREDSLINFKPNKENELLAKDLRIDIERETESFKKRHRGEKTQYEFSRWLKSAKEYQESKKNSQTFNETRCSVPEYGPGHPRWEELHGQKGLSHASNGSEISRNNAGGTGVRKAKDYLFQ